MVHSLMKDIKHTSEVHKLITENLQVNYELSEAFDFTVEQSEALQQKNDQLEQAQEIMSNQSFWLQRMMEKLKELKSWPLEDPNIDPDTAI